MTLPTFAEMKEQTAPVWKKFEKDVQWAGIFGSVSRARVRADSDVDFLVVLKKHLQEEEPLYLREGVQFRFHALLVIPKFWVDLADACGRAIDLVIIWQGPSWAWGNLRIEALLTARTVYGSSEDIAHYHRDALGFLDSGLERFEIIAESVSRIKAIMTEVKTCEVRFRLCLSDCFDVAQTFIHSSQDQSRQAFLQEADVILHQLDLPYGHPTITMLLPDVGSSVQKLRTLIDKDQPDARAGTAPFWEALWTGFQPGQEYLQAFDRFCSYGPPYIRNMLAAKRLAEAIDSGAPVTQDMYVGVK
ncbi:hypothetical protein DXG01_007256 [Tephrocybe rancida]|nr:hypothetical protein DXG01_007256 [Tephrocybe rancida]